MDIDMFLFFGQQFKKEVDAPPSFDDCLQVSQLQIESLPQAPSETVDMRGLVTGPTTDLYSGEYNPSPCIYRVPTPGAIRNGGHDNHMRGLVTSPTTDLYSG